MGVDIWTMKALLLAAILLPTSSLAWMTKVDKDRMTDEKTALISQPSKNKVWAGKKATLVVEVDCNTKKAGAVLHHPWVVQNGQTKVRFDSEEPYGIYAAKAAGSKALIWGDDSSKEEKMTSQGVVDKMLSAKKATFRYRDASGEFYDAEFSLAGLSKAYAAACK